MKKFIALLLVLTMAFSLGCAFAEEDDGKLIIEFDDTLSFAMRFPEGYTAESEVVYGTLSIVLESEDESAPRYVMLVAPSEEYAEVERLNDLSDAEIETFAQYIEGDLAQPVYEVRETGLGTKLLVIQETDAEMDIVTLNSIYHGYLLVTYIVHLNGETVTDEEINTGIQIYTDMDFLE